MPQLNKEIYSQGFYITHNLKNDRFLRKSKLPFSQYLRFLRQGELSFSSSPNMAYVNTDVPKCWRNSLVSAAERLMFIYQTKWRHTSKRRRYSITLFVITTCALLFVIQTFPLPADICTMLYLYVSVHFKHTMEKHVKSWNLLDGIHTY
jgi:hypothetical protein